MKTNNRDYLTQKPPLQALLILAFPIILGNLFQQFYNMADSAIVGRYVGEQALAAVGASFSLTNVFIYISIGGGMGASVIIGTYFGGKLYQKMKTAVFTAMFSLLGLSIVLAVFGLLFSKQIMIWLNTPADVLDLAVEYLNIYFLGLPFLFMYNVFSSMFNCIGKSRIPLCFLIFSSVLNVVLDVVMVTRFGMGVAGVAWATLIAQGLSAVLSCLVFMKELRGLESERHGFYDFAEFRRMIKVALPSIFQQSTVSIGLMLVQSVINGFGSQALAGYSAASRVDSICFVPMIGLGNALSSYTAQNIGAGKLDRVQQGYKAATASVITCAAVLCLVIQTLNEPIIRMFLGENGTEIALSTGMAALSFTSWFYCGIGFKQTVDGVLRGARDMKMFTIANLVNLGIRVTFAVTMAPRFGIAMVWTAVPIGWFVNWLISYLEYRTGKWKTIYKPAK